MSNTDRDAYGRCSLTWQSRTPEDTLRAGDDGESTIKGTQSDEGSGNGTQSTLGEDGNHPLGDSPMKALPHGECEARMDGRGEKGGGDSVASYDSSSLWAALDSPPRSTPALAQFDEHEFAPYEDGELSGEELPPLPNQEPSRTRTDEVARERADRLDKYMAASEEERRSARRPRIASQGHSPLPMLPPIRELIGNPWSGMGGGMDRNFSLQSPVPLSTPKRPSFVRDMSSFHYDSLANVSGHPPTLRGSSIDTTSVSPLGDTRPSGVSSRASARSRSSGMMVDNDPGYLGSSLLERPTGRRRGPETSREQSLPAGPWNLRDALGEDGSCRHEYRTRDQESLWRSGYRPSDWGSEPSRPESRIDEEDERPWIAGDHADLNGRRSLFSALPNTKAWDFRQGRQEGYGEVPLALPSARRETSYIASEEDAASETGPGERAGDSSYGGRAGRSQASPEKGAAFGNTPARGDGAEPEWWQETRATRLPTALMKEKDVADIPLVVDNPHSSRWAIHLSDPEEKHAGMSMEWMKTIWMDGSPTVFFTVFNYRFTRNQEINRHIETNVTAMTTHLTGESGFHVVPPDPEWRHELRARDLPYLWVIRGLSEAAAWEMVKLRVISARGVSIITHPKVIENPSFVCGLAGFLRPDVKTTKIAVLSVLESPHMIKRLAELVRTSDRLGHLPIGKRVEKVINSLDVRFMATKEDGYVANIYILPPSDDLDEWRAWAEEMRACRFNVFLNGTGSARKAFWCGGCRGVDHEDQECPFPRMRGWKGPQAGERLHTKFWAPETTGVGLWDNGRLY
ncbi:hypothetical protein C8T65DRAFT_736642 [Cerioporus squamosus]|nr:hypothetical protein C8T65DRAFT_736642 [Cerioporus squamosus]